MIASDRSEQHPGYWPSAWPVECGGNRRQKARAGRLDAASGRAEVVYRRTGRWNVMAIERDPGQWYLGGTMPAFTGPPPYGWLERIDPLTLEPIAASSELPCGDHVWCGAILAHANGSIYSVNGSFLHRLSPDCEIEAEMRLPVDRAHNGLLALSDGTLLTKDLRIEGQGATTLSRLDPETLELVEAPLELPEGSMGRIARRMGMPFMSPASNIYGESMSASECESRKIGARVTAISPATLAWPGIRAFREDRLGSWTAGTSNRSAPFIR